MASQRAPKAVGFALPIVSFVFMATIPAGVALYSVASSVLQYASQKLIS